MTARAIPLNTDSITFRNCARDGSGTASTKGPPPPPAPPSRPPAKTGAARPRAAPAPERDAWSQRLAYPAQQLSRPAPGAEPWQHEDHGEALGLQAAEPGMAERQPGPNGRAANGSGLRLLGYYAQDESGRWVWLPAGSENAPPAPPAAPPPPPR